MSLTSQGMAWIQVSTHDCVDWSISILWNRWYAIKKYSWKHKAFIIAIIKAKPLKTIGLDNGSIISIFIHEFAICSLLFRLHGFISTIYHRSAPYKRKRMNLKSQSTGLTTFCHLTSDQSLWTCFTLCLKKKGAEGPELSHPLGGSTEKTRVIIKRTWMKLPCALYTKWSFPNNSAVTPAGRGRNPHYTVYVHGSLCDSH